jgi:glycosyltransferase involved in cell wall biosynthesis
LLESLQSQSDFIFEIIVVNDSSSDKTLEIAKLYNVKTICVSKPSNWKGKNFACYQGAKVATR